MTTDPWPRLAFAALALALTAGRAEAPCIGFDRFPDDLPQSVSRGHLRYGGAPGATSHGG